MNTNTPDTTPVQESPSQAQETESRKGIPRHPHWDSPAGGSLYDECELSEQILHLCGKHIQNSGLKLLIKSYGQTFYQFKHELAQLSAHAAEKLEQSHGLRARWSQGMLDMRIALVVGRQNRQQTALDAALERVAKAEAAYQNALGRVGASGTPDSLTVMLRAQHEQLVQMKEDLQELSFDYDDMLLVRLFEDEAHAQEAIARLEQAEELPKQIVLQRVETSFTPIEHDDQRRRRQAWNATLVSALLGVLIGGLFGAVVGFVRPYFDPAVNFEWIAGSASVLSSAFFGALTAASAFSLFGVLLSQGMAEEDSALSESGWAEGAVILFVHTDRASVPAIEPLMALTHQREVSSVPANAEVL